MTPPVPPDQPPPEKDIGPFYKFLATLALVAGGALVGIQEYNGKALDKFDIAVLALLVFLVLALIRPNWLDRLVKIVAAAIPFTKYGNKS